MRRTIVACLVFLLLGAGANAADHTGTLKKISKSGIFTIGYNKDSAPFSFLDPEGKPVGYSVDLCRRGWQ